MVSKLEAKNLKVGIEVEISDDDLDGTELACYLSGLLHAVSLKTGKPLFLCGSLGLSLPAHTKGGKLSYSRPRLTREGLADYWVLKEDGSCGLELNTPATRDISIIHKELKYLFKIINSFSNSSPLDHPDCGLHIHVGLPRELSRGKLSEILTDWVFFSTVIQKYVDCDRWNSSYCLPVSKELIRRVRDGNSFDRCYALNVWPATYRDTRTIEVRLSDGTSDPDRLFAWAEFCRHFIAAAIRGKDRPKVASERSLFQWIKLPERFRRKLSRVKRKLDHS